MSSRIQHELANNKQTYYGMIYNVDGLQQELSDEYAAIFNEEGSVATGGMAKNITTIFPILQSKIHYELYGSYEKLEKKKRAFLGYPSQSLVCFAILSNPEEVNNTGWRQKLVIEDVLFCLPDTAIANIYYQIIKSNTLETFDRNIDLAISSNLSMGDAISYPRYAKSYALNDLVSVFAPLAVKHCIQSIMKKFTENFAAKHANRRDTEYAPGKEPTLQSLQEAIDYLFAGLHFVKQEMQEYLKKCSFIESQSALTQKFIRDIEGIEKIIARTLAAIPEAKDIQLNAFPRDIFNGVAAAIASSDAFSTTALINQQLSSSLPVVTLAEEAPLIQQEYSVPKVKNDGLKSAFKNCSVKKAGLKVRFAGLHDKDTAAEDCLEDLTINNGPGFVTTEQRYLVEEKLALLIQGIGNHADCCVFVDRIKALLARGKPCSTITFAMSQAFAINTKDVIKAMAAKYGIESVEYDSAKGHLDYCLQIVYEKDLPVNLPAFVAEVKPLLSTPLPSISYNYRRLEGR
jgi:hypothetical protein